MVAYESEACRVWTGALGAPLHAIEDAEQCELDVVPCSLQIWVVGQPEAAAVDRQWQQQRGIHLIRSPEDARTGIVGIVVFCQLCSPSPFVSSVLVVLDVDETRQQGFFFGRVRRSVFQIGGGSSSSTSLQSTGGEDDAFYDTEVAEELLATLHSAFPKVPMSSSAKECLAKRSTAARASIGAGAGAGEMVKRRRTLSATAFYGSGPSKPDLSGSNGGHQARPGDVSWRAFYEKLQFRVSHSLLCQLEGTAPISSSFPRQLEAFEFADQVAALRRRLRCSDAAVNVGGRDEERWPRVFSFESASDGKRRFLVASFPEFWRNYLKTRADRRHVYEIIREGLPCRLYLDLEFQRDINPQVDGDTLFNFANDELFADNLHVGSFMREFISDLVASSDAATGELVPTPFLVNTKSSEDPVDKQQLFIDTGVYTRNRMFRVLGSSKHRKRAILRVVGASASPSHDEFDRALFLETLVCPYASVEAMRRQQQLKPCRLLRCEPSPSTLQRSKRYTSATKLSNAASVECRQSVFPALDAFIRSQATKGGVQGEIRAIQMLMDSSTAVLPGREEDGEPPENPRPWMLIYHMARNRWCANVGRPHKSNNVMFIVDLDQRVFYQKCHDPTCQAMDFRYAT
ncbi:hypothetical protein BBJ28_00007246 [Nothophytophthora sp. Chile5]|nr:hypothetical protein BBJ28_00007246 [Nothophytophthora sp. Chile5]